MRVERRMMGGARYEGGAPPMPAPPMAAAALPSSALPAAAPPAAEMLDMAGSLVWHSPGYLFKLVRCPGARSLATNCQDVKLKGKSEMQ